MTAAERPLIAAMDASDAALLPAPAPLPMPAQDFSRLPERPHGPITSAWVPRAAVFLGAALMTAAFAHELYKVLSFVQMTPIQLVFLALSTITFGWIAIGTLSAALGFLPLFAGETADTIPMPASPMPASQGPLRKRVALLFPVYHEDEARIAGTIAALSEELVALGQAAEFDIFILSDTRGDVAGANEERAYRGLKRELSPSIAVYYRRRLSNTGRKAGNIKDWVERFGAAYESFIILDGDSIMSGDLIARLARAIEADATAGLIQTVPKLTGGTTLLQKLIQFASNTYGPPVAAGLAFWSRNKGNYWGHNAIIRTRAFASAAGLPDLKGPPPFGGHIMSHDFVEAVLLQRAGWRVHMVPTHDGSYEGLPPRLADLIARDRRWSQGNLQHLAILPKAGLTGMGRLHLAMGAMAYIVSAIWAASLMVGIVLALQGQQIIPTYFHDSKTLFPIWPVIDPGAAMRLFFATMAVVLFPKLLGLVLEIQRAHANNEILGAPRALAGVAIETVMSMLLAPIMMMTQTSAVVQFFLGLDAGWKAQSRDGEALALKDAVYLHRYHALTGIVVAALVYESYPGLLVWMAPVLLGLVLSGPINWITAKPAGPILSRLLSTHIDRAPAPILVHTERHIQAWRTRLSQAPEPAPISELRIA